MIEARVKPEQGKVSFAARKLMQEPSQLFEESDGFSNVLGSLSDGVLVLNESFRYVYWNRAMEALSGRSSDEMLRDERVAWEIFPHLLEQGVDQMMRRAMEGEVVQRMDIPFHLESGKSGYTTETFMPVRNSAGMIVGIVGVIRDTTERVRAEAERHELQAQLLHVQRLEGLGVFAGGIAHDFNNLLAALMGHAELIADDLPAGSETRESADAILAITKNASALCKQILMYAARTETATGVLNLSDCVREVGGLVQVSIGQGVQANYELAKQPLLIEGDASKIQQIVMNLLSNASEACEGRGGRIDVKTSSEFCSDEMLAKAAAGTEARSGEFVVLEVRDSGVGMNATDQAHIFDPYVSSKGPGRGLGLAVVYGLVRAHGGVILIDSVAGQGTTIRVLFPRVVAEVERENPSDDPKPARVREGVLLLADDTYEVRFVMRKIFTNAGFEVVEAIDGIACVDLFAERATKFRAVVCDMAMPGKTGSQVFFELRNIRPDIPMVLISGNSSEAVQIANMEQGVVFLQKPFGSAALLAAIDELLAPS